jgi:hypothetical protein
MPARIIDLWVKNWKGAIAQISRLNPVPVAEVFGGPNSGAWEIESQYDGDLNDSDKTVTVPETQEWQLLSIFVDLTTSATANARQLQILIQNVQARTILDLRPNVTQIESLQRYYNFAPSLANQAAFYDTDQLQTPLPPTGFLKGNYTIRIWDNNAVDAAADDMLVTLAYAKREI